MPTPPLTDSDSAWIEEMTGEQVDIDRVRPAVGATSSTLYMIPTIGSQGKPRFVLRLHTNATWIQTEPDLALHEFAALHAARRAGLPVPEAVAFDKIGKQTTLPALLMTFREGRVVVVPDDFERWLEGMALQAASIHQQNAVEFDWHYRSWVAPQQMVPPSWSRHPALWERAFEIFDWGPPRERSTFIHRDYHPTNLLWRQGKISAVVDWINACIGPAAVDVAHCRANLKSMYGVDAAERFLTAYRRFAPAGYEYHPYWDIESLVGQLPEPGFYPPWLDFGLASIPIELRKSRHDEWLKLTLDRFP